MVFENEIGVSCKRLEKVPLTPECQRQNPSYHAAFMTFEREIGRADSL